MKNKSMKWVIFTGTWRLTNKEVENDVLLRYAKCSRVETGL